VNRYLNNAATSYPKPERVTQAVLDCLRAPPSEPERGYGLRDTVQDCRRLAADFLGIGDSNRVCFTSSGTDALNTAILGSLGPGDQVIYTQMDHNSVTRPLAHLVRDQGVEAREVGLNADTSVSLTQLREALGTRTRVAIITHVSNVTGTITPLEPISALLAHYGTTLIIDASQSVGLLPLNVTGLPTRTILAAAGHKGLYGPSGMGLLVVPDDRVGQRIRGGTGVRSEDRLHPMDLPLRHEAGSHNTTGIAGLHAGLEFVSAQGSTQLATHRNDLVSAARGSLASVAGVTLAPLPNADGRAGIVTFGIRGMEADQVGFELHSVFGIDVRAGLHCAPGMHRALGSFPGGLIRASFGVFNDETDVRALVDAVAKISLSR